MGPTGETLSGLEGTFITGVKGARSVI